MPTNIAIFFNYFAAAFTLFETRMNRLHADLAEDSGHLSDT